jgi:hypothetical protein
MDGAVVVPFRQPEWRPVTRGGDGLWPFFNTSLPDPAFQDPVSVGNRWARSQFFRWEQNGCERLLFISTQEPVMTSPVIAEPISPGIEQLELLVQRRVGNRVRDLRIIEHPNGVILQGRATTYHAKQLAQHAAMEMAGRRILANDIEVR